ncbi:hypothetical protein D3C86_1984430 [compost metagenome]
MLRVARIQPFSGRLIVPLGNFEHGIGTMHRSQQICRKQHPHPVILGLIIDRRFNVYALAFTLQRDDSTKL